MEKGGDFMPVLFPLRQSHKFGSWPLGAGGCLGASPGLKVPMNGTAKCLQPPQLVVVESTTPTSRF